MQLELRESGGETWEAAVEKCCVTKRPGTRTEKRPRLDNAGVAGGREATGGQQVEGRVQAGG